MSNNQSAVAEKNDTQVNINKVENKKYLYRFIKRIVDILGGIVGCLLLVPITLVLFVVKSFSKEE